MAGIALWAQRKPVTQHFSGSCDLFNGPGACVWCTSSERIVDKIPGPDDWQPDKEAARNLARVSDWL